MTIEIDRESWPRRRLYEHFRPMSDPFYALTFPVDVTPLRAWCGRTGCSFYPALVYGVTRAMERVDAFLYKDRGGVIVKHDRLVPSFTDLKPGSDLFHPGGGGRPSRLLPPGQGAIGLADGVSPARAVGPGRVGLLHLPALVPPDRAEE